MNERMATLVVLPGGLQAERIARLAEEHASFAPDHRRVIRATDVRGSQTTTTRAVVAIVLNARNEVIATLDAERALNESWIEDAFLCGARPSRNEDYMDDRLFSGDVTIR